MAESGFRHLQRPRAIDQLQFHALTSSRPSPPPPWAHPSPARPWPVRPWPVRPSRPASAPRPTWPAS
ncbi:MAG: hypothetical protein E6K32_13940 [Gammaproteobacteria bacterium]|nr:MAG: hypothetical protein E6K30_09860 [Gammaproteobacteria bacterium]TLZ39204.1 MAG: hypothetical protein E6K32_13940 [Gammaproteobacteria bacterium]